jgi:hypothetical protein
LLIWHVLQNEAENRRRSQSLADFLPWAASWSPSPRGSTTTSSPVTQFCQQVGIPPPPSTTTPSPEDVSLDFRDGMLGEILVDFTNNPRFRIGMQRMPQVCERAGRSCKDQCWRSALWHEALQSGRRPLSKTMLLDFMPIRRLHSTAADCVGAREGATGAIGSLIVRRRILVEENALGHQIAKPFVTFVAQKKRLAAVTGENGSIMLNTAVRRALTGPK